MVVTDEHIDLFARLSGDRNPLHFDDDFARRTRFGRRVVHGGVTTAILNALVAEDLPGPGSVFLKPYLGAGRVMDRPWQRCCCVPCCPAR